ncbi:F420-0:Gamma-glutamyl ligase [Desulfonispora thiosulfatigenes DSM 11270]|uniref:F420-0:Gamma-glutamyl ligase n=1 Tax=Desulfonispora thiosulfatigenes DSM 11270 TaxID=656914 RepID=A0A1W1UKL0_DESTI|nr:coenzyme F420-0:L-glutamate ligase [Desulfonispora thiosulfatigenes]SMB81665.1 F420-0:Gamma-glutamyl ligase [Desulfonispora thiosulfatigenes DSM 11270]
MSRTIGTTVRGIIAPIVKQGDDLVEIVVDSVKAAYESEKFTFRDKDVVGITESLVARAQGNYITIDDIAEDVSKKINGEVGVVFPILSRNRFSMLLEGIAKGVDKVHLLLSYPSDEVGNHLMDIEKMDEAGIDPFTDVLSEEDYRKIFGKEVKHPFTDIDYIQMYKDLGVNGNVIIHLANNPKEILKFTKNVIVADIHSRERTKKILKNAGAEIVLGLDDICSEPSNERGYNSDYGLYGSNKASETMIKLFPRDGQTYVDEIQARLNKMTGKNIEVMIYGDGAFKDPVGKIWELADPVVSPAYTKGLEGTPNELKLKYLADNNLINLENQDINEIAKKYIKEKDSNLSGKMVAEGTTPRQITDLLGSLCDLTSGSGDKGTPIILIQGYFDNYATDSY